MGVEALEPDGRSKSWVVTRSLRDICIGMNAYKCLVIGRRDVAVRYMIHFYCLAVEAGFYSDVECRTLNLADRVRSPVGENVIWIFLLSYYIQNAFSAVLITPDTKCVLSCINNPRPTDTIYTI